MKYPKVTRREETQTDFDGTVHVTKENDLTIVFSGKQIGPGACARLTPIEAVRLCQEIKKLLQTDDYLAAEEALLEETEVSVFNLTPGDVIMYPFRSNLVEPKREPCLVVSKVFTADIYLIGLIALADLNPPKKVKPHTITAGKNQRFQRVEEE